MLLHLGSNKYKMDYFSIDFLTVCFFLLITLAVGLWAGRGIKDMREYAMANKMYETGVLTMTILATYITGSKGIGFVGHVFNNGIIPLLPVLVCGVIFCFGFIIKFIVPRMQYFQGCLTAAELMGVIYGPKVRFTIAIIGSLYSLTLVIRQISWIGSLGELISIPTKVAVLLIGILLVLYSAQGGIKSVTATDVMYFVAIVAIMPLITYFVVYKVGGVRALFNSLPSNYLAIAHHPNLKGYLFHAIWYLFPAFPLSFPFIQHMLMAQNTKSLTTSYYLATIFLVVFFLLLTLVGLSAIVIRSDIDCNIPSKGGKVFLYMVKNYFSIPCKGFIAVGLLAGVMSTADSFLHTTGLLLTHDVIQPFCRERNIAVSEYSVAKMVTICAGVLALWGAYNHDLLPYIQYAGVSLNETLNILTRPVALVFTIPMIAGIMGLKGDEGSFFTAFFITICVFILSYLYLPPALVVPVGIVTNTLTFLGSHFMRNSGFVCYNSTPVDERVAQEYNFKGGE